MTLVATSLAAVLGWAMWNEYMGTPWTRDATVRTYVATMASEVAGRIVALPVADNQFVHKGDLLMVIDPINYQIGVSLAEAATQQAQASIDNIDAQTLVQQAQISASEAELDQRRRRSYSHSSRRDAIMRWRGRALLVRRMPSSTRRSCASRKPRCSRPIKT